MPAVTTTKKTNFILSVIAQAQAAKAATDALSALAAVYSNEYAAAQTLVLGDADFAVSGATQHMTAAQMATFFSGYETALASAQSTNLQGLLAVLPQ